MSKNYCLKLRALLLLCCSFGYARGQALVSTVAGSGVPGATNGPAATAQFNQPYGVAVDAQGTAYVADRQNHLIRKITAAGVVTTFAGTGTASYSDNNTGTLAGFDLPHNVLLMPQGNLLVADTGNGCIRQITPTGVVSTFAGTGVSGYLDGPIFSARFAGPIGLAQDAAGNVYVADADNFRIRRIDPAGNVTTIAGSGVRGHLDGPAATARFFEPQGIAVDAAGNLFIADRAGNRIRKLTPAGVVSTYAGAATAGYVDGLAATARFNAPIGVAVDGGGDVYVMDRDNQRLRRIEAGTGLVSTVAGAGGVGNADGPALTARFSSPRGITSRGGSIYVADLGNHRIRRVTGLPLNATAAAASSLLKLQLDIFPSPLLGEATVRYQLPRAGLVSLTLYDVLGRPVLVPLANSAQTAGWHEIRFSAQSLPSGLYIGQLLANGATISQRLVVGR